MKLRCFHNRGMKWFRQVTKDCPHSDSLRRTHSPP